MRHLGFSFLVNLVAVGVMAQEPTGSYSATSAPASARYEIIQSSLVVRHTFRLDKFTGRVHQMVKDTDGSLVWEEMVVHDRPTIATPSNVRFQLFSSGSAVRHTYLLDTTTGATWQIQVVTPEKRADGTPIPDAEKVSEWFAVQVYNIKTSQQSK